jgi:hypothetical protein
MIIVALYTKISEYTQKISVTDNPKSLSFHILRSHVAKSGKQPLQGQL